MTDIARLPAPLIDNWNWQAQAACRGMDVSVFFHPPQERNAARERRIALAKTICRSCPAIEHCLDHALKAREPYGIWGGMSEDERAGMLGLESLRYPKRTQQAPGTPLNNPIPPSPVRSAPSTVLNGGPSFVGSD